MFDLHLKHDIVHLEEGSKFLRNSIKQNSDKGLLKKEFCEKKIIRNKGICLRLERLRNETIKLIEKSFNEIIA